MVWQPGVVGTAGEEANAPPSILYWIVKSCTDGTDGKVNPVLQVLAGEVITGEGGKMTTFTIFPGPQGSEPAVPAGIVPQAVAVTYLALML